MGDRAAGFSRRTYLGMVGAASGATLLAEPTLATDDYSDVVDIVEAGADNTGHEPIDDVFHEHAEDDTLIEFPDGTYVVNQLILYQLSNFAMVGKGDATLVPGDDYEEELWIAGGETRDLTIRNFTLDTTQDGVSPEIDINAYDGLEFRDIVKRGYQDHGGVAFGLRILDENGSGLIQNVRAPDGGESVGLYIESDGPMTVRNCQFEEFCDNGVYASASSAPIRVEGGFFRNNNISQVRLGSADSVVRDARMVVNKSVTADDEPVNMRGVRVADGPGPVHIENCDISMMGGQGNGGIVNAFSGGSMDVRDTRIHVDEEYTTVNSDGSRTSYGIFVDDATQADPGSRTIQNVSITGGGSYRAAMLVRRSDNTMEGLCIDQQGQGRNGIVFEDSTSNSLVDSVIDVPDEELVLRNSSVRRSGVSTSGSCPSPGEGTAGLEVPGEFGSATLEQTTADEWHGVGFQRQYENPVVVSKPLSNSYSDSDPAHVRPRNVGADGFDLQIEEWQYLDGDHRAETANFLAVAAGTHTADDLRVDVGHVRTNHEFTGFSFDQSFDRRPVVLAQCQTYEGADPVVTRLRNVSADGAEVMLQEEEGEEHDGYHNHETVGYIAMEPGSGTIDDQPFEVGVADIHEAWDRIEFDQSYNDPRFVAGIQTFEGPNTANLRYRDLSTDGVEVHVEEEQSQDEETLHRYERVGYAVFESS